MYIFIREDVVSGAYRNVRLYIIFMSTTYIR